MSYYVNGTAYILFRQELFFGSFGRFGWLLFYILILNTIVRVRTFSSHLASVFSVPETETNIASI